MPSQSSTPVASIGSELVRVLAILATAAVFYVIAAGP